jgi:hypothetical protein
MVTVVVPLTPESVIVAVMSEKNPHDAEWEVSCCLACDVVVRTIRARTSARHGELSLNATQLAKRLTEGNLLLANAS